MDEYNVNNLTLDDNTFEVLPDGDYHFTVESHEYGFASSEKLPANTRQVTVYLDIPHFDDTGAIAHATVRENFNIYKKALFAIRRFVECIELAPEKGRINLDLDKIDGMCGVCALTTRESKNGNEYNTVQMFYPPSKAPTATANDEAWKRKDDFIELPDELPFD